jgi:nicotinate-nucleotide pyrophosphorylase (carboxylating)/molybdenum transport protein
VEQVLASQGAIWNDILEIGLKEDCPYGDITTELLDINGCGKFRFVTRVDAVVSGTCRLKEFFETKKLNVLFYIKPGTRVKKGDVLIEAEGELTTLFKLWRICQTYLTVLCAIATQTQKLVAAAQAVNPDIQIVVACRKAHLGMRIDEIEAVQDGGAIYHRNSLSDTILITQNHMRVLSKLPDKLYSMQHRIEFEPSTMEEAYQYANSVEIMLLDHFEPGVLREVAGKLREINSNLQIGVAGGITLETVKDYAGAVDIIVLSSVLYAAPLDITCRIEKYEGERK